MKRKAQKKCKKYLKTHKKTETNNLIDLIKKYHLGNWAVEQVYENRGEKQ